MNLYTIEINDIDGNQLSLSQFKGYVLLIVNVASQCGLASQYIALQSLYEKYAAQGLRVLGVPCNQFGGREPDAEQAIKENVISKYNITFPLTQKVDINGDKRHSLYQVLAGSSSPYPGDIQWNFEKFLIGKNGVLINRFEPTLEPTARKIVTAIEAALN